MPSAFTVGLVVCLGIITASVQASTLYGTYLNNPYGTYQSLNTVLLSQSTGAITNITDNIRFIGQPEAAFTVSAFDQRNGNFFFSTNYPSDGIFGTNTRTKQSLPVRFLDTSIILSLTFDDIHGRLFALHLTSDGTSVGIIGSDYYRHVMVLPRSYNGSALVSTVDGNSNTYFLAGNLPKSVGEAFIASIDVGSGKITNQPIDNNTCSVFITYVHYNTGTGRLVGGGASFVESGNFFTFFFLDIDPATGACKEVPLLINGSFNLVFSWTFDDSTGILWYAEQNPTGSGSILKGYNTLTGQFTGPVRVAGSGSLTSIEIDSSS